LKIHSAPAARDDWNMYREIARGDVNMFDFAAHSRLVWQVAGAVLLRDFARHFILREQQDRGEREKEY
jgi:hypothetical protein